jgi:hypothetical protein
VVPRVLGDAVGGKMSDPIEHAARRGEAAVRALADLVDANESERATIARIEAKVRHGYGAIDLVIRKDGIETRHQADWLARLLRVMK